MTQVREDRKIQCYTCKEHFSKEELEIVEDRALCKECSKIHADAVGKVKDWMEGEE